MAFSNALHWLTVGIFVWTAGGSELCERDEIFPYLEFPYFKSHLHIGESLTCSFKSPNDQKVQLKWECMTTKLFKRIETYKTNVALVKLHRLKMPEVFYKFKNNWCSCRIRLHRIDGSTCEREVTQFVELLPPPKVPTRKVANVSIGATRLSWLHENIIARGCPSINLCRDERYPRNSTEDTKMVLKKTGAFRDAIRPHPAMDFGTSFRYPFAVLDICKMKESGLFFYTCIHRDRRRGPEEKMYLNLTWDVTQHKIKNEIPSKPKNRQKPALPDKTKSTIQKSKASPKSEVRPKKGRKGKKERRPKVKTGKHYNRPKVSSRYQKQSLRQKYRNAFKVIHIKTQKLKERTAKLDQTLTGVKIAVVGCVLLFLASLAWFYHGTQLRNRYREQAKCACN